MLRAAFIVRGQRLGRPAVTAIEQDLDGLKFHPGIAILGESHVDEFGDEVVAAGLDELTDAGHALGPATGVAAMAGLAVSGRALVDAHVRKQDLGVALQTAVGWRHFEAAVVRAEVVSAPDHIDPTAELVTRHRSVRLFGPALLQHLVFDGSAAMRDLLAALDVIRATYAASRRKLPPSPPVRFVPRRWRAQVIVDGLVDRPAYELCAFSELRERLRAGDVWVVGSGRYRAFGDYLLPEPSSQALRAAGPLPLAIPERFEDYLADRRARLETMASTVADLARVGKLADVRLDRAGLTITPLRAVTPAAVRAVRQARYARMPEVRITDVLMDVDAWTGFGSCFTHRRTGHPCNDPSTLLTCVLADGINMGLTRMARTCRGASLRQLALAHDWHISEPTTPRRSPA